MQLFGGQEQRKRSYKLAFIGISCVCFGLIILFADPLNLIVDYKLSMRKGSFIFELWEKPPLEVYIRIYVFNLTNVDRYLSGADEKLKVNEIGPYVYREFLENHNATINANNTLSFRPRRWVEFIPEKSIGDPKDHVITVPNIPYMGVTTAASQLSPLFALGTRALMSTMSSKLMLNMSVHDYLWGYDDPLVKLASNLLPGTIHFKTFGLLDRMFDEGDNLVTINLPSKNRGKKQNEVHESLPSTEAYAMEFKQSRSLGDMLKNFVTYKSVDEEPAPSYEPEIRDFSIDRFNGQTGLPYWGYREGQPGNTECNTLRGSYDGTLFPRKISRGERFRVYRKTFCRSLPIIFSHPGKLNGIDAYHFKLAENAFDSSVDDPQSSCFCSNKVCLKRGLGNIAPCYYNIPAAVSFPHFFNADPSLLNGIEGLNPNEEQHGTVVLLQPQLGVPMKVHTRFQLNLLMGDVKFNHAMKRFKNTVLPIAWLEISIDGLTPHLIFLLQLLFNICPYVQTASIYILIIVGISTMGLAGLVLLCVPHPMHEYHPKRDRRYSAISMFPYIRRQLEKYSTEEGECLTQEQLE